MIVVIADDFSGAAEMCGVALRYGLTAEVQTQLDLDSNADLVAIDTDSRNCPAEQAGQRLKQTCLELHDIPGGSFYKKIDSALRGAVLFEAETAIRVLNLSRALLVPSNPGLGRVIRDGHYYVDGKPIHETDFGKGSHFAHHSSEVSKILYRGEAPPATVIPPGTALPASGVAVGEAASDSDLVSWAEELDADTLPGGAAEFFAKFLEQKIGLPRTLTDQAGQPAGAQSLFICGTASSQSRLNSRQFTARNMPMMRMPRELFRTATVKESKELVEKWASDTVQALDRNLPVLVNINRPFSADPGLAAVLTAHMADLVEEIMRQTSIRHICATGGATASHLVRRMGWTRLRVVHEVSPGVVSMLVRDTPPLLLTVKPGTYRWPEALLG